MGFGRFPWMTNQNCPQPLSHHSGIFVLTDYRLVSAPPQRSSNALCPRYLRAWKGHPVRWMMSSFTEWASQNMMDTYERFFTAYKKLGWPLMTNVSFHNLQFWFLAHIIHREYDWLWRLDVSSVDWVEYRLRARKFNPCCPLRFRQQTEDGG